MLCPNVLNTPAFAESTRELALKGSHALQIATVTRALKEAVIALATYEWDWPYPCPVETFETGVSVCVQRNLVTPQMAIALLQAYDIGRSSWSVGVNPTPSCPQRRETLELLLLHCNGELEVHMRAHFVLHTLDRQVKRFSECIYLMLMLMQKRTSGWRVRTAPIESPWDLR